MPAEVSWGVLRESHFRSISLRLEFSYIIPLMTIESKNKCQLVHLRCLRKLAASMPMLVAYQEHEPYTRNSECKLVMHQKNKKILSAGPLQVPVEVSGG